MKKKQLFDLQAFKLSQACVDKDPKTVCNFLKGSSGTLPSQNVIQEWFNYFSTYIALIMSKCTKMILTTFTMILLLMK